MIGFQRTGKTKILSLMLAVCLLVGLLPMPAFAAEGGDTTDSGIVTDGEIIAFEALPEATAAQTVSLGTVFADLNLPDTLTATVRVATETDTDENRETVQGSVYAEQQPEAEAADAATGSAIGLGESGTSGEESGADEAQDSALFTELTIPVPVSWAASPDYDGDTAGAYTFTAEIEGFTVSAEPPQITVTVEAGSGGITGFIDLDESIRFQRGDTPNLPETVEGTVDGKTTDIPVTWACETDTSQTGLHAFIAQIGAGYTLAEDVAVPTIAFMHPKQQMKLLKGAGTTSDPLEITNAAQLAEVAALTNAGMLEEFITGSDSGTVYLELQNDLDLSAYASGEGWTPIGSTNPFWGSFDGGGHKITGLTINRPADHEQGLFGAVAGGTLKNIGIEGASITGQSNVGGIAGMVMSGTVQNCYVTGSVTGGYSVGGVAGVVADGGTVENCYSTGSVTGSVNYVGGVAGYVVDGGTVKNCYSTGSVTGTNTVGGIAGAISDNSTVQNCAALNPSVSSTEDVGRVVGAVENAATNTLINNYAFSGMTVTVNSVVQDVSDGAADNKNGEGKTAAEISAASFFETLFADDPAWIYATGKLPGFGAAADMPAYIADTSAEQDFPGTGESDDPYQIATSAQLAALATLVNGGTDYSGKYFKLMSDLDLSAYASANSGTGWMPIGNISNPFKGTFDGNNKKITGLFINRSGAGYQGLFSYIRDGTVKNLGVIAVNVTGDYAVGGVAGYVHYGTVENCYSTGSVTGSGNRVGGVAGYVNEGTVQNCYSTGSVTGSSDYVGGVAGEASYGTVENCYSTGSVTGSWYTGGVAGYVNGGTVENCYSTGSVTGSGNNVGGVAGYVIDGGTVKDCAALNPSVNTSGDDMGRVVGRTSGTTTPLQNNYAYSGMTVNSSPVTGNVTDKNGADKTAAEIGDASFWTTAANWDGAIWTFADNALPILTGLSGQDAALPSHLLTTPPFDGGDGQSEETAWQISTPQQLAWLAARVNAEDAAYNSKYYKLTSDLDLSAYASADSGEGWTPVGNDYSNSFNGTFDGNNKKITGLTINRPNDDYQGLFGVVVGGTVKNLGIEGASITGYSNVGGVAGEVMSGTVENCSVTGSVTGSVNGTGVGGVAGAVAFGTVQNCYVTGSVTGGECVGGIAGGVLGGTVQNCYSTGSVTGTNSVGGVAGEVYSGSTVENCYVTGSITGSGAEVGGVAGYVYDGTVENCAALNPSVSGTNDVGRVIGYNEDGTLSGNYAFSGMTVKVNGTVTPITGGAADNTNGADINASQAVLPAFWTGTMTWDTTTVWTAAQDKLPVLTGIAGQDGSPGLYLTAKNASYFTVTTGGPYTYSGSAVTPTVTVKFGATTLTEDTDYTFTITSTDNAGSGASAGTNAGTVSVTVTGMGAYTGTTTAAFTIAPKEITVTPTPDQGKFYGGDNPTLTYTFSPALYGSDTLTGALSRAGGENAGTYAITLGTLSAGGNYTLSLASGTVYFTIAPKAITVTPAAGQSKIYGENDSSLTFTNSENLASGTFTGALSRAGGENAGTYAITLGTLSAGGNYTLSLTSGTVHFTITPKAITVTPAAGQSKIYGENDSSLTFTNSENLASGTFTGALSRAGGENAGTYAITLGTLSAGGDYTLSLASGTVDFTIAQREITLTADNKAVDRGGSMPELTYTVGNLASGETAADALSAAPALACPTFDGNTPGSYDITLTGGTATSNYTITARTGGALTVAEQFFTVTFNLNSGTRTGGGELTQTVAQGAAATAPTVSRSGYTLAGWDRAYTNVTADITVTAIWSYNGGGSGDSGGSGGDSYTPNTPATTTPEKKPDQPTTAAASVTATAGTNGTASASIPDKTITDAIAKAQAEARTQGRTASGISVGLNIAMPQGATSLSATLSRNALNGLVSAGISSLEIAGSPVTVTLDQTALAEIQRQSTGSVNITIAPRQNLSAAANAMIGTRPVYDITVGYGSNQAVSNLGRGTATIAIPYTPAQGEAAGYLYGVYVDENGNAVRITGSAYDANAGAVLIPTGHLSVYGVGYTAPGAKFTDIAGHWAKESIDYAVGRGLLAGTSDTAFSPDTAMTRGMLVTALGRLAGADTKLYTTSSFSDVKAGSTFQPYIEWAYKKGVIQGTGNGKFEPDRAVTREEIAVIFANFAKATGYTLPVTREATAYADASGIGSIYKTAVTAMQQAGIMMGGSGNKFNPKASATRAEVSSMLHRYIKLTIDPATAQGWAKNDAGQYMYYKNAKVLTGWQTIDGVKYFFETNGTLKTGWVKDGSNWRYYSGNKALTGWWNIGSGEAKKTYYFTTDGIMVSGKWLQIDGKWYYFYADGGLAVSTKIDGYEVDENGARKTQ